MYQLGNRVSLLDIVGRKGFLQEHRVSYGNEVRMLGSKNPSGKSRGQEKELLTTLTDALGQLDNAACKETEPRLPNKGCDLREAATSSSV